MSPFYSPGRASGCGWRCSVAGVVMTRWCWLVQGLLHLGQSTITKYFERQYYIKIRLRIDEVLHFKQRSVAMGEKHKTPINN